MPVGVVGGQRRGDGAEEVEGVGEDGDCSGVVTLQWRGLWTTPVGDVAVLPRTNLRHFAAYVGQGEH